MIYQLLCVKKFFFEHQGTSVLFCFFHGRTAFYAVSNMYKMLNFLFFKHNIFNQLLFLYLRRVNAIEHVIIPRIERTLAYIISELGNIIHIATNVSVTLPTWRPRSPLRFPLTFNLIFC